MILKNKRDTPSLGTAQVLDKKHLKKRSTKLLKAYHLMKNLLIIFSVLLSTPLYGQISPDGTGIVNGVYIGPNTDLSGADLTDADLTDADLTGADLTGAILSGVIGVNITGSPILPEDYQMVNGYIVGPRVNLSNADLSGANLAGASAWRANFTDANFTGADLSGINLMRANLTRANFTSVLLIDASLNMANLSGAQFALSIMDNVNLTSANLNNVSIVDSDLVGAIARYATFSNAFLRNCDLTNSKLYNVDLNNATFIAVNLTNVTLSYANLDGAVINDDIDYYMDSFGYSSINSIRYQANSISTFGTYFSPSTVFYSAGFIDDFISYFGSSPSNHIIFPRRYSEESISDGLMNLETYVTLGVSERPAIINRSNSYTLPVTLSPDYTFFKSVLNQSPDNNFIYALEIYASSDLENWILLDTINCNALVNPSDIKLRLVMPE